MYSPLDTKRREIRVVDLLPGDGDDAVEGKLRVISLDGSAAFEALSYVWGDANDVRTVILDGIVQPVTKNLESALHYLRYVKGIRTLWIDAICINQADIDERNHQVRQMSAIYSFAAGVVVWLRPSTGDDAWSDCVEMIRSLSANQDLHWRDVRDIVGSDPTDLIQFLSEGWWTRVWTLQEAVLATRMTYYCGSLTLSDENMLDLVRSYEAHFQIKACCHSLALGHPGFDYTDDMYQATRNVSQLYSARTKEPSTGLLELSTTFRNRNATDPRDKVFGLLGICHDISEDIINYKHSVATVYEAATREIIKTSGSLDVLHYRPQDYYYTSNSMPTLSEIVRDGNSIKSELTAGLPSWVPDWDCQLRGIIDMGWAYNKNTPLTKNFNACGTSRFNPQATDEIGSLAAMGILYDRVREAGILMPANRRASHDLEYAQVIKNWRRLAGVETIPDQMYVSGGTCMNAFWRTLCWNVSIDWRTSKSDLTPSPEERALHDEYWYDSLLCLRFRSFPRKETGDPKIVTTYRDHIMSFTMGRKLISSEKGYLGLAPLGVECGDIIGILAGGKMPFILRPSPASRAAEGSQAESMYCLIGDAYIHGLMDGEAVDTATNGNQQMRMIHLV